MNSNCQRLHETVLRDIVDVVTNFKDMDEVEWLKSKGNTGSIARRANNLVLVFPVLVSTQLSIETCMIISKAIERKCVALLQVLFSSIQTTHSEELSGYLSQFHKNLNLKGRMDLNDFMDTMDDLVGEGVIEVDMDKYQAVKEDMQNINFYLSNEYNPIAINDYKIRNNAYGESCVMLEKHKYKYKNKNYNDNSSKIDKVDNINYTHNDNDTNIRILGGGTRNIRAGGISVGNSLKDNSDYYSKQLLDGEIKKANELMPTLMMVNFTTIGKYGEYTVDNTAVVGVKAKLYPVDSVDIINRLTSKAKDKNGLFNFVRASTREISFFKDLAFAIDKAKMDAQYMASDSNNAKMFRVLERRATKNKLLSLLKKNDASPITSLVISQSEVDYMKQMSLDMEKSHSARVILEAYNLMDIVIADEQLEIAKFMFDDGDGVWEALTFDALEKEQKDNTYKKVVNLVSKINR